MWERVEGRKNICAHASRRTYVHVLLEEHMRTCFQKNICAHASGRTYVYIFQKPEDNLYTICFLRHYLSVAWDSSCRVTPVSFNHPPLSASPAVKNISHYFFNFNFILFYFLLGFQRPYSSSHSYKLSSLPTELPFLCLFCCFFLFVLLEGCL